MLFDGAASIFTITSVKKHIEYFNFRRKIQLDHPVVTIHLLLDSNPDDATGVSLAAPCLHRNNCHKRIR